MGTDENIFSSAANLAVINDFHPQIFQPFHFFIIVNEFTQAEQFTTFADVFFSQVDSSFNSGTKAGGRVNIYAGHWGLHVAKVRKNKGSGGVKMTMNIQAREKQTGNLTSHHFTIPLPKPIGTCALIYLI